MASSKRNPHYGLHNKVLKLEGPNKSMLIKAWNKSVNYMLRTLEPTMTPRGLLNFYPHCNNELFAKLFPVAAGPNPPAMQRQIPIPVEAPLLAANATFEERKARKLQNEPFVNYTTAVQTAWHEIMASFDDSIYTALETMAGANDILDIDLPQICSYINGPTFAYKSEENISFYEKIISSPVDLNLTLQENFEKVENAWAIIKDEAPSRAPTQNAMFAIMKAKLLINPRVKTSINAFMKEENITALDATFDAFKEFILNDYRKTDHDSNTSHQAFAGDTDYIPLKHNRFHHALGAAATDSEPEEPTALAAKANERIVPEKDWAAYQKFIADKKKPPKLKEGMLCFYHGWNSTHDSTMCALMRNDPKFTANQRAYTEIPPNHDLMVDKVKCNVHCARGIKPKP